MLQLSKCHVYDHNYDGAESGICFVRDAGIFYKGSINPSYNPYALISC